jgi:hypothetical protein
VAESDAGLTAVINRNGAGKKNCTARTLGRVAVRPKRTAVYENPVGLKSVPVHDRSWFLRRATPPDARRPAAPSARTCHHFWAGVVAAAGATFGVVLAAFLCFFTCFLATGAVVVSGLVGVLLAGA